MNVLKLDNICMEPCSTLYATSVVHFLITLSSVCGKYISVNLIICPSYPSNHTNIKTTPEGINCPFEHHFY